MGSTQDIFYFFQISHSCRFVLSTDFKENYWYQIRMPIRTPPPLPPKNRREKSLETVFRYDKVTIGFQKYSWKCVIDPLITLEIQLNFLIWEMWEPWIYELLWLYTNCISVENTTIFNSDRWCGNHYKIGPMLTAWNESLDWNVKNTESKLTAYL